MTSRPSQQFSSSSRSLICWLIFFILLFCAAYWRHFGFYLPSHGGDSSAYMANAMKLNHGFMRHYDVFHYAMVPREQGDLVDYVWEDDPQKWNSKNIRSIYHRPLHMQPPLYPMLIWISHGLLKNGGPYTSVKKNLGPSLQQHAPSSYMKEQGYAVIVPFLFSLLTLLWVYLFALRFYNARAGLLAVLILIGNPLEIAVGSRVYADGILTNLSFLSLFLFFLSLEASCRWPRTLAALAGFILGLSFLTKFTGVFFAAAFPIALLLAPHPQSGWRRLWDSRLFWAALTAFFTALPWNLMVYHHYGTFLPNTPWSDNPWFLWVFNRPWYLYPLGLFVFAPPNAVGLFAGLVALYSPRRYFREATFFLMSLLFLGLHFLLIKTRSAGLENRYLLPIYPLLAILAAWGLENLGQALKKPWLRNFYFILLCVVLGVLAWKSAQTGLLHAFRNLAILYLGGQ